METFQFDLVTPEASFFSGPASMVEAPGELGDFGVLIGHMNFISTLRPGVVTVHNADDTPLRIFVSGGTAEVNPVSCTILAEQVIDLDKTSQADAQARLTAAKTALDNAFEEKDIIPARKQVELAEALIATLG